MDLFCDSECVTLGNFSVFAASVSPRGFEYFCEMLFGKVVVVLLIEEVMVSIVCVAKTVEKVAVAAAFVVFCTRNATTTTISLLAVVIVRLLKGATSEVVISIFPTNAANDEILLLENIKKTFLHFYILFAEGIVKISQTFFFSLSPSYHSQRP